MKSLFFLIFFFELFSNKIDNIEDKIKGKWITPHEKEVIKIYKDENKYKAKIIGLKYPTYKEGTMIEGKNYSKKEKIDLKNPNISKREEKLIGLHLSENLSYDIKRKIWKGSIYNPSNGKKYSVEIKIKNNKLELRSYIGIFYKTQIWFKKERD